MNRADPEISAKRVGKVALPPVKGGKVSVMLP